MSAGFSEGVLALIAKKDVMLSLAYANASIIKEAKENASHIVQLNLNPYSNEQAVSLHCVRRF